MPSDRPADDDHDDEEYEEEPRPRRRRRRPPPPDPMDDPAMGLLIPVNTSVLAMLAGYAGLFAVLCIPAPIALILGIVAMIQLKNNPKMRGHGRAIFGIIMGGLGTLAMVAVGVAAAMGKLR